MANKIARIVKGEIIYLDEHAPVVIPNETQARANREEMKTNHRKDLLQKNEMEYWKAYPEQAKELSPELRRLLS